MVAPGRMALVGRARRCCTGRRATRGPPPDRPRRVERARRRRVQQRHPARRRSGPVDELDVEAHADLVDVVHVDVVHASTRPRRRGVVPVIAAGDHRRADGPADGHHRAVRLRRHDRSQRGARDRAGYVPAHRRAGDRGRCTDSITFAFGATAPAGAPPYVVEPASPPFALAASGQAIALPGSTFLRVKFKPSSTADLDTGAPTYTGSREIAVTGAAATRAVGARRRVRGRPGVDRGSRRLGEVHGHDRDVTAEPDDHRREVTQAFRAGVEDDLAEGGVGLDQRRRRPRRLVEREHAVDDGRDPAVGEQRDDLGDERGGGGGLLGDRARPQHGAVHLARRFCMSPRSGNVGHAAGERADDHDAALRRDRGDLGGRRSRRRRGRSTTSGAPPASTIAAREAPAVERPRGATIAVVEAERARRRRASTSVRAVPVTVQPNAFASCTTAVPTPDPTACTSTYSPGCEPAAGAHRVVRGDEHLGDAARVDEVEAGRDGRAVRRGTTTYSACAPPPTIAEDPVADRGRVDARGRCARRRRRTPCRGCRRGRRAAPGRSPARWIRSARLSPAPCTRTSTSPGPGSGTGRSSTRTCRPRERSPHASGDRTRRSDRSPPGVGPP